MIADSLLKLKMKGLAYSRLALYTAESLPIIYSRRFFDREANRPEDLPKDHRTQLLEAFNSMLEEDIQNIKEGLYSEKLVRPEPALDHLKRYFGIWFDSLMSAYRKSKNQSKVFSKEAEPYLEDLPDYYKRNFHYQTDGYLTETSAEMYSHQTEILFQGTLSLMRRVLMGPILRDLNLQSSKVRILEIGCGAGELTEILLESKADMDITCIDLSEPYLKVARKRFAGTDRVEFVKQNGEDFKSKAKFDLIISGYLFHELPLAARIRVMENSRKLLKRGGRIVAMDSLQMGDSPQFDWALKQFPKDFHEPFYTNYTKNPVEDLISDSELVSISKKAFLSKLVYWDGRR